ncbi:MAG: tetraacyldisaccharide 4'-kinase [Chlamydiia bacterium]
MQRIELWWQRAVHEDRLAWLQPLGSAWQGIDRLFQTMHKPQTVGIPVIGVGSPFLGGTGKTPFTIWLAQRLQAQHNCAVLMRGYRRASQGPQAWWSGSLQDATASRLGDEAALLARLAPGVRIQVDAHRWRAAQEALQAGAQLLLLDDAFQQKHLHVDRRCAVLVQEDLAKPLRPFPSGRLRHPIQMLQDMDIVVLIDGDRDSVQVLADRIGGPKRPFIVAAKPAYQWQGPEGSVAAPSGPVAAFCGVGRPHRFWKALEQEGCDLVELLETPDHQAPSPQLLQEWAAAMKRRGAQAIVCTAKDAVKGLPALSLPVWQLEMTLSIPLSEEQNLLRRLAF